MLQIVETSFYLVILRWAFSCFSEPKYFSSHNTLFWNFSIVPESPRWLMISGCKDKAEKIVKWIGEVNASSLPDDFALEVKVWISQKFSVLCLNSANKFRKTLTHFPFDTLGNRNYQNKHRKR